MSIADYGIDRKYQQSDQRAWLIKCDRCNTWQELTFEDNLKVVDESLIDKMSGVVRPGATQYVCKHCGKNIESERWYSGEWVKKYPDSGKSAGFFVSQMNAVWLSSDQIFANSLNANSPQLFHNYTLGKPYQDTSLAFATEDVTKHMKSYLPKDLGTRSNYAKISVGIDWG